MNYIKTKRVIGYTAIRVKNSIIAFLCNFNPKSPTFSISCFFISLIRRVLIDEISYVFIDHGGNPSRRSSVELDSFFFFVFGCSNFDFFTRDGAVDLIGGRLRYVFGVEILFGKGNDGERIGEIVRCLIEIMFWSLFHRLIINILYHIILLFFNIYSLIGITYNII